MGGGKFYGNQHTLGEELEYDYVDMVQDISTLADSLNRPPTTRDAVNDPRLPSIRRMYRLLDGREWNELLADAGVGETQVGEYEPGERPAILRDIRRVFEQTDAEYLTVREYDRRGKYNKSVVKRLFDTWSSACSKAEVPHGRKHGRHGEGPTGEILDSRLEVEIAQAITEKGLEYDSHRAVPGTSWECDFYLPKLGYWIEVDGYLRDQRPNQSSFEEKLTYYRQMDHMVVRNVAELEEKVFQ